MLQTPGMQGVDLVGAQRVRGCPLMASDLTIYDRKCFVDTAFLWMKSQS
jgi:hypothetical protein